jgi:anti-sigma B factor antagonist
MNAPVLEVGSAAVGGAWVVSPRGDVDLMGSPTLKAELRRVQGLKPGRIVVDLSGVSYMDSSGLATLVECMQGARKQGFSLVLCGMQARVRAIFEIAKLTLVFAIVPTLDDALKA